MTGTGEASNGLLVINFAARFCSFCNFSVIDIQELPPNRAAVSKIGLYQTSIHCFNRSGWKILLCITKNVSTPGDLFRDSG